MFNFGSAYFDYFYSDSMMSLAILSSAIANSDSPINWIESFGFS